MNKTFIKTRRFATAMAVAASLIAGSIPFASMTAEAATTSKTASEIVADMTVG